MKNRTNPSTKKEPTLNSANKKQLKTEGSNTKKPAQRVALHTSASRNVKKKVVESQIKTEKTPEEYQDIENEHPQTLSLKQTSCLSIIEPAFIPYLVDQAQPTISTREIQEADEPYIEDDTNFFPPGQIFTPTSIQGVSKKSCPLAFLSRNSVLFLSGNLLVQQSTNTKDSAKPFKILFTSKNPLVSFKFISESNILVLAEKDSNDIVTLRIFSFYPFYELASFSIAIFKDISFLDGCSLQSNRFNPFLLISGQSFGNEDLVVLYNFDFKAKKLDLVAQQIVGFPVLKCKFMVNNDYLSCLLLGDTHLIYASFIVEGEGCKFNMVPFIYADPQGLYHFVDFVVVSSLSSSRMVKYVYALSSSGHILIFDFASYSLKLCAITDHDAMSENKKLKHGKKLQMPNANQNPYLTRSLSTVIGKTISPIAGNECIVVADNLGTVKFLSLDLNEIVIEYHVDFGVCSLLVGPSGELLLLLANDSIGILNPIDGSLNAFNGCHTDTILSACYNRLTSKLLSIGKDTKIFIWSTEEGFLSPAHIQENKGSRPLCCQSQSVGEIVLIGFENGIMRMFDLKQLKFVDKTKMSDCSIIRIASSLNDKLYAILDIDFNLFVINDSLERMASIVPQFEWREPMLDSFQMDFDPNGLLLLHSLNPCTLNVFDIHSKANTCKIFSSCKIVNAYFAFAGKYVFTLDVNSSVQIHKKASSNKYMLIKEVNCLTEVPPLKMVISLNCKYLFLLDKSGVMRVWNSQFRGKGLPESRSFELFDSYDDFLLCDDFFGKIFLLNRKDKRILCVEFKGNLDIDDTNEELFAKEENYRVVNITDKVKEAKSERLLLNAKTDMPKQDMLNYGENQLHVVRSKQANNDLSINIKPSELVTKDEMLEVTKINHPKAIPKESKPTESSDKTNYSAELILGLSCYPDSQCIAIDLEKRLLVYLYQNKFILSQGGSLTKNEEYCCPMPAGHLNYVGFSSRKRYIVVGNTGSIVSSPQLVIYETVLPKTPCAMIGFDNEVGKLTKLIWCQQERLFVTIMQTNNQSVLKLFQLTNEGATFISEASLSETLIDGLFIPSRKAYKNSEEFILISTANIYFFKISSSMELMYQSLDFSQFKFFQIDYNFTSMTCITVEKEILLLIGTAFGSLLVVDVRSASVISSFNFIIGTERIKSIHSYSTGRAGDQIRIVLCTDTANIITLGPLSINNIETFTYNLSVASKQIVGLDGKIFSIDFDNSQSPKCAILTENKNVYFADLEMGQKVKIKSWHSKDARVIKSNISAKSSHLVTIGNDDSIKFWNYESREETFEFLTPGKKCLCLDIRTADGMIAAGYSDGFMRFYFEEEYILNACIQNNVPLIFLAFSKSFRDILIICTRTTVFLGKIDEELRINLKQCFQSKSMILYGAIAASSIEETFALILENGEVQVWTVSDILENIELPENLNNIRNKNKGISLHSLSTSLVDSFDPFPHLKSHASFSKICFSEFEHDNLIVFNEKSNSLYIRNCRQGVLTQSLQFPSGVTSVIHLKGYMGLCVGLVTGEIAFVNHFNNSTIAIHQISNEPIKDLIENWINPAQEVSHNFRFNTKQLCAELLLLTESGVLRVSVNEREFN